MSSIRNTTWKHIRRSPYQAVAAVMTLFLTFLLGGFFFLITSVSQVTLNFFESKPQITIFFQDTITPESVEDLKRSLNNTGLVSSLKYVSKDEALEIYRELFKDDPLLLEMVTADILPASLEVSAADPAHLEELANIIRSVPDIEDISYQKDVVDALLSWTNAIRFAGIILGSVFIVNSLLVIIIVIGMKIALRKEEIEILSLVGASPWFIKAPFIFEGVVYGLVSSTLAWSILMGLILYFRSYLLSFLGTVPSVAVLISNPTQSQFIMYSGFFLLGMITLGLLMGIVGSLVSVSRYLKIK